MKNNLLLGSVVAVGVVGLASFAFAGDYHFGQDLICSDCHVMHYSQQHGYSPDGTSLFTPLSNGPHDYLLRAEVNELCLACHDGQSFAPDVFEANFNGFIRQAGGLNDEASTGDYYPTTGHTLGATDTPPGDDGSWATAGGFSAEGHLTCVDCHSPHGRTRGLPTSGADVTRGGYRNLFVDRSTFVSISYSRGDVDGANGTSPTTWIHEDESDSVKVEHYGQTAMTFNEPVVTGVESRYADMCKACHVQFHGVVTGPEIGQYHRHPTGGANLSASFAGRLATKVNQVQCLSPTGKKAGTYLATDTDLSPSCMTCHKGHGNQNAFGLVYMLGTGTKTEEGDAGVDMRNSCRQCHSRGGSWAGSEAW